MPSACSQRPWLGGILGKALGLRPMFGITAVALLLLGLAGTRLMDGHRAEGPRSDGGSR